MAEDTNKLPAAATQVSIDEALNQAAADAVAAQEETPQQEPVAEEVPVETQPQEEAPETPEEPKQELDDEGLPKDHQSRSDLGRKLAAMHRRQDETSETLARISQLLEKVATSKTETPAIDMPQIDPDEPVTFKEVLKLMDSREQKKMEAKTNYDRSYSQVLERSFSEYVDEKGEMNAAEIDGVLEEMRLIKYTPSSDPEKDALSNLRKAERAYLKKQTAQPKAKVNPLKGETPRSPLGTAGAGKPPVKASAPIKLDPHAEAYLKSISASEGAAYADKLRASMGRGD
jgi:hypothetical protein